MNMIPVKSSQVSALGFNPETLKLRVRFKPFANKKATEPQPEPTYEYSNVSQADYDAIFNAESIGRAVNQILKSNVAKHPFRKLNEGDI